jgi:hypothetical protein
LLCGAAAAAVIAEVILHMLPYSTGYGVTQVDATHPIGHGTPNFDYTYSRDWSFHLANSGSLNNEGYRASYDYQPDPKALLVVGNSFIQADAVLPANTLTERLGTLLGRKGFAVGGDGFSLADYAVAADWAAERFAVHEVLILLTTEDLVHSCTPRSGQYHLRLKDGQIELQHSLRPAPSRLKQLLNRSSLFRYLFDNLHVPANWTRGWKREQHAPAPATPAEANVPTGCATPAFRAAATEYLLTSFRELQQRRGARVVFVLAPDYFQRHTVQGAYRDVDEFADRAQSAGFTILRLKSAFEAAADHGIKVDLTPIDRHWSTAGNEVAAQALASQLR